jgi:hypothetical protein
MGASFVSREKRRHTYYVCRTGKKREPRCRQKPVASTELEPSLFEKLEPMLGADRSNDSSQAVIERVVYDSRTREVSVSLCDGSRFGYCLPVANRPGVTFEEQVKRGRVARVSRLMALAIKFQRLIDEGAARNYAQLAELGHVTRPRLSQIMMLTNLAPSIQEALLFLPRTVSGRDCVTERQMRHIAGLVDWEAQRQVFRAST